MKYSMTCDKIKPPKVVFICFRSWCIIRLQHMLLYDQSFAVFAPYERKNGKQDKDRSAESSERQLHISEWVCIVRSWSAKCT